MRDALPSFLRHISHRSPRTQETYGAIVASFFAVTETRGGAANQAPTRADVEALLARPRRDGTCRSPAGRNQELAALRAFVKFAQRDLGWTTNPTEGIPFLREPPRAPAVLSVAEVGRLFQVAVETAPPKERTRNLALLAVLAEDGLRVHTAKPRIP